MPLASVWQNIEKKVHAHPKLEDAMDIMRIRALRVWREISGSEETDEQLAHRLQSMVRLHFKNRKLSVNHAYDRRVRIGGDFRDMDVDKIPGTDASTDLSYTTLMHVFAVEDHGIPADPEVVKYADKWAQAIRFPFLARVI